jgi:hypothetical protein
MGSPAFAEGTALIAAASSLRTDRRVLISAMTSARWRSSARESRHEFGNSGSIRVIVKIGLRQYYPISLTQYCFARRLRKKWADRNRPIQAPSSRFYSEWWQFGAPEERRPVVSENPDFIG